MLSPFRFNRLRASAAMLLAALMPLAAHAQSVLLLDIQDAAKPDTAQLLTNIKTEFVTAGATVTEASILGTANAVTPSTFVTPGGGAYDIVIVASLYPAIHSTNWPAINTAIQNRSANAFLMLNDGCFDCDPSNVSGMLAAVNAARPATATLGSVVNGPSISYLNTNSPSKASFTGITPLYGGYVTYFDNVPANNALFLRGNTPPTPGTKVNDVYSVLIPTAESYAGKGACLFASVDITMFHSVGNTAGWPNGQLPWYYNKGKIGPAFLNAVKAGGACGLAAEVSKTFTPDSVAPGGASTLSITVKNDGGASVTGIKVTDNLPSPLTIASTPAASTTCTGGGTLAAVAGSSVISLTGATLAANSTCTITVPVQWPAASAPQCDRNSVNGSAINTIRPGTDFTTDLGQVNTQPTATLACQGTAYAPAIDISKTVTSTGAYSAGSTISYQIVATNSGNVGLDNVQVNDDKITPSSTTCTSVAPGDTCTLTGSYTVAQADIDGPGHVLNHASTRGMPPVGTAVSATTSADTALTSGAPALQTAKTVISTGPYSAGSTISYKIVATNSGTVTLSNVQVKDDKITPASATCTSVAPGATCTLTGSYTVTAADANAGHVLNNATAEGTSPKSVKVASGASVDTQVQRPAALPVPTLGQAALMLLGLMLAALASRQMMPRG